MADITVDIVHDVQDESLKIKWRRGSHSQYPYKVRYERIRIRSKEAREALQNLVHAAREKGYDKYGDLLKKVAIAGNHLYDALFLGITEQDRRNAERAKAWVENWVVAGQDTITFTVPSRVHIPWGLIHDNPDSRACAENVRCPDPDFWCVKFGATTHYHDIPPEGVDTAWPQETFPLLFGAHEQIWTAASSALNDTERRRFFDLLTFPAQPKFTLEGLFQMWKEKRSHLPHGLLSFYCHSSGSELFIERELSALEFEEQFSRNEANSKEPPTLVFLAGCQTAIGDLHTSFLEVTSSSGYCGFIGTEVKVPDVFTLRFLVRFFDRFFGSGKTVGQIMRELRQDHWPLSLVFSVCCAQDLRLRAATASNTTHEDAGKDVNLSFEPVSTVPSE